MEQFAIKEKDPYQYHGLYNPNGGYIIKQYNWETDNDLTNISDWIEDAISRVK